MYKDYYLDEKKIKLSNFELINSDGAEGDIYNMNNGEALKVFKDGIDNLKIYQEKLNYFPEAIHPAICFPKKLLTDGKNGPIIGYSMRYIENSFELSILTEYISRNTKQISNKIIIDIFKKLHLLVSTIHRKGFVIGDFNESNIVLSSDLKPYIIDTDSFQFDEYVCNLFKEDRIDPLLCKIENNAIIKCKKYTFLNDWYSFADMLFECLLLIKPYSGVIRGIKANDRKIKRISVFDERVGIPKGSTHYNHLPENLLIYFYRIFENDLREPFNISLLENIDWKTCNKCNKEHARETCPSCNNDKPIIVNVKLKNNNIFETSGKVIFSKLEKGELNYIYFQNGKYYRENNVEIMRDSNLINGQTHGNSTLFFKDNKLFEIANLRIIKEYDVDSINGYGVFSSNTSSIYRIYKGVLYKNDSVIKKLKYSNSMFWLGEKFGFMFGYSHNSNNFEAFVFNGSSNSVYNISHFPKTFDKVKSIATYFSVDLVWVFISYIGDTLSKKCLVYDKMGNLLAENNENFRSKSWMSLENKKFAINNFLYSVSDIGLLKLKLDKSRIIVDKLYPDKLLHLNHHDSIYLSEYELYVVNEKKIRSISFE